MRNKHILMKILKMTQNEVKVYAKKQLKLSGYSPILRDGFIYAEGDLPVLLVAHMDTVFKAPKYVIQNGDVLSGKRGLGADDRAGIFGVLELVAKGYRPSILFLEDEEIGCVGAGKFILSGIDITANCIIELDRQGKDNAVFYDLVNTDFETYITDFGFRWSYGSYSDISVICPHFNIAGVNLSVGYYGQHTRTEKLVMSELETTLIKVENILENLPTGIFDYFSKEYYERKAEAIVKSNKRNKKGKKNKSGASAYIPYSNYDSDNTYDWETDVWETYDGEGSYEENSMIPITRGYLILDDGGVDMIDLSSNFNYYMSIYNEIYHLDLGLQRGAIVVNDDYEVLNYDDVVDGNVCTMAEEQMSVWDICEEYYKHKGEC